MTSVLVLREEKAIKEVRISGHAMYASHGNDIVCAGISAFAYMTANNIIKFGKEKNVEVLIEDGEFQITVKRMSCKTVQTLLESLVDHLKSLSVQYKKHLKVKEV